MKSESEVNIQYRNEYFDVIDKRSKQNSSAGLTNDYSIQIDCIKNKWSNEIKPILDESVLKIENNSHKKSIKRPNQILSIYSDEDIVKILIEDTQFYSLNFF